MDDDLFFLASQNSGRQLYLYRLDSMSSSPCSRIPMSLEFLGQIHVFVLIPTK